MTVFAPQASLNFGDLGGFGGSQFRCDHFAPQASLIFGDFWGEWRGPFCAQPVPTTFLPVPTCSNLFRRCDHFAPQASLIFGDLGVEGSGREWTGVGGRGVGGSWREWRGVGWELDGSQFLKKIRQEVLPSI